MYLPNPNTNATTNTTTTSIGPLLKMILPSTPAKKLLIRQRIVVVVCNEIDEGYQTIMFSTAGATFTQDQLRGAMAESAYG